MFFSVGKNVKTFRHDKFDGLSQQLQSRKSNRSSPGCFKVTTLLGSILYLVTDGKF